MLLLQLLSHLFVFVCPVLVFFTLHLCIALCFNFYFIILFRTGGHWPAL